MNSRILKELRPLVLPWVIAAVAGCLSFYLHGSDFDFVAGLLFTILGCSVAVLCAMPWGTEFQHGTLPLLLSQPCERSRLWLEKTLVLVVAAAALGMLHYPFHKSPTEGLFVLATICSTGYWTIVARSTVGGTVLSLAAQCLLFELAEIAADKFALTEGSGLVAVLSGVTALYSMTFLWLSRRGFLRVEVRDGTLSENGILWIKEPEWFSGWLTCRPSGAWANLIRKELRLLQPIWLLAAGFAVCTIFAIVPQLFNSSLPGVLDFVACFYLPLLCLLAGCMSLGEEKSMGLADMNLTLPASPTKLWLAKLVAGFATVIVFGLVLPFLTTRISGIVFPHMTRTVTADPGFWPVFAGSGAALCIMGFWAATLEASVVRAALAGVIGSVLLIGCTVAGATCAWHATAILGPHFLPENPSDALFYFAIALFPAGIACTLLVQSFLQFRRSHADRSHRFKSYLVAAACTSIIAFCCMSLLLFARPFD